MVPKKSNLKSHPISLLLFKSLLSWGGEFTVTYKIKYRIFAMLKLLYCNVVKKIPKAPPDEKAKLTRKNILKLID